MIYINDEFWLKYIILVYINWLMLKLILIDVFEYSVVLLLWIFFVININCLDLWVICIFINELLVLRLFIILKVFI